MRNSKLPNSRSKWGKKISHSKAKTMQMMLALDANVAVRKAKEHVGAFEDATFYK